MSISIGILPIIFVIYSPRSSLIDLRLSLISIFFFELSLYFALANSTICVWIFFTSDEYTNPLDSIWIFPTSSLVLVSTLKINPTTPLSAIIFLAFITYSPERCPFPLPSIITVSSLILFSEVNITSSYISIICPLSGKSTWCSGIPIIIATFLFACLIYGSPWIGQKKSGFKSDIISFRSSWYPCPEVWISKPGSSITSTQSLIKSLIIPITAFSFPGIVWEDRIIPSSGFRVKSLKSDFDILTKALNSSPWEPVQSTSTLSSGRVSASALSWRIIPFGAVIYPNSWQSWTFATIDLPARKMTLLYLIALLITWIILPIFDANVETISLLCLCALIILSRFSPMSFSDGECPGFVAFVDSQR